MKKIVFLSLLAIVLFSCRQKANKTENKSAEVPNEAVVLTVDELLEQAPELADREVVVKGTVFHVCQHGGQRCFLMGSSEDMSIRIEAGEAIGAFKQEQMGSELEITGVLKEVKSEADAHNPDAEHGEGEHEDNAETQEAHKIIAENHAAAEKEFFIEGAMMKEL